MLERNELARAMTELPDELLLEQERTARPQRIVKFRRIIAAAATIALLAVTVGAVTVGVDWTLQKVSRQEMIEEFGGIYEEYYDDPTLDFEKLEMNLPLEVVELPQENMGKIQALTQRMAQEKGGNEVDFYVQIHGESYSIPENPFVSNWSFTDVENMLGITLDIPNALRTMLMETDPPAGFAPMVNVRLYARTSKATGNLEPQKVVIYFNLSCFSGLGQAQGTITVPLTEEAAWEGLLVEFYSYEKEGPIWQEERTLGGYAVNLMGNDPQEGYHENVAAAYTSGGIGYEFYAHWRGDDPDYFPDEPYYASAMEILLTIMPDSE